MRRIISVLALALGACSGAPTTETEGAVRISTAAPLTFTEEEVASLAAPLIVTQFGAEPVPTVSRIVIPSGTQVDEYNDQHGRSLALGDFNGDGRTDLAVGVPFEDIGGLESSGSVIIYRGSAAGIGFSQVLTQAGLGADEHFDHFGYALVAGDFDGDGKDDLAVGAPDEAVGSGPSSGAVFVFRGSVGNMAPAWVIDQQTLGLDVNELGDRFGEALSSADYDGDGKDDLAIGAPGEANDTQTRSGVVYVARGQAAGLIGAKKIGQTGLGLAEAYDRFGSTLASGRFTGSQGRGLAVGCYNDRQGERGGAVFVYSGGGLALNPLVRLVQPGLSETGDQFGVGLAVGDFDGNGWDDLAVGAPGENRGRGAVYLYRGSNAAVTFDETLDPSALVGSAIGDRFGAALAAADYDGDGLSDLVVAATRAVNGPAGSAREGRLIVLQSSGGTMTARAPLTKQYFTLPKEDDQFGRALVMGRGESASSVWVVAGAPARTQGVARAGATLMFRGTNGALPSAWRVLVQD